MWSWKKSRRSLAMLRPYGRIHRPWLVKGTLATVGLVLLRLALPWPLSAAGAIVLVVAAVTALVAVVRWDRTRFVVTTEKVFLVQGVTRRRASAVMLSSLRLVALDQTLPGRLLGYGTLQAGPLEVDYVPDPRRVRDLVERLAA